MARGAQRSEGGRPNGPAAPPASVWALAGAFTALALALSLAMPQRAYAADLFPIDDWATDILGGVGDIAGDIISKGFEFIIQSLFGGKPAELTLSLLRWLIAIPNLSGGDVRELSETTTVIALALLAALATVSVARFWVADLSLSGGGGGFGAIEGLVRAVLAAAAVAAWPFAFGLLLRAAGALPAAMLGSTELRENVGELLAEAVALGGLAAWSGVPLFLGIAIAVVGMLFMLALVAVKIVLTALTVVIFLAMPIAIVLWIVPELGWIARLCFGALLGALAIPLAWTLIFGAFAALWSDTILLQNNGKGGEVGIAGSLANVAIVKPMVAIALMYLALAVPKRLVSAALSIGGGGLVRGVASQYASQAVLHRLPAPTRPTRLGGASAQPRVGTTSAPQSAGSAGRAGAPGTPGQASAGQATRGAGASARSAAAASGLAGAASAAGVAAGSVSASTSRASGASSENLDKYGGPRHSMSSEHAAAMRTALAAMERTGDPRPDAKAVHKAHRELPAELQAPVARALWQEGTERGARRVLAGYAADPHGTRAREQLVAIGRAERGTWHGAISRPAEGEAHPPAQDSLPGLAPSAHGAPSNAPADSAAGPRQSEEARRALGARLPGSSSPPAAAASPPPSAPNPGPGGPSGATGASGAAGSPGTSGAAGSPPPKRPKPAARGEQAPPKPSPPKGETPRRRPKA